MKSDCCAGGCASAGGKPGETRAGQAHNHDRPHDHNHDHDHEHPEMDEKKELAILGVSTLFFAVTLIFENSLIQSPGILGIWVVRAGFALPYLLCGIGVFKQAFKQIARGNVLNEFTLMSGATVAAIILGELPEAVGVMLFYRIGEYLQEKASAGSRRSIRNLLASKPTIAHVLEGGVLTDMSVESVLAGTQVEVRPGEKIPLDGIVLHGESQIDQSPLTGESLPITARPGQEVLGGSLNIGGVLTIRVTSPFADTHMARILELVENAVAAKSPTERFISRFARYYTPTVFALAILIAVVPPLATGAAFSEWVYKALVLLVISCPCALMVSIPLGYFGGIGLASRRGILVKGGTVLDSLLHIDTVVFDKTGTLTQGVFEVSSVTPVGGATAEELLEAAVLAESRSNHPVARSIIRYAEGLGITIAHDIAVDVAEIPGKGMSAVVHGQKVLVGSAALLKEHEVEAGAVNHAGTLVYVARGGRLLGYILVADVIKPEAAVSIETLKKQGMKTYMLTGDREEAAAWVAAETGIDGYRAGLLPEGKVKAMEELADGSRTVFVGDGINDAPILALARVGVAMGGAGSEAAIEAADAVVLNDSPAKVPELFGISRVVRQVVLQNIVLAIGIKTLFMVLGVVGLSGLWEAVFADVGVALLAVANATRIMRK